MPKKESDFFSSLFTDDTETVERSSRRAEKKEDKADLLSSLYDSDKTERKSTRRNAGTSSVRRRSSSAKTARTPSRYSGVPTEKLPRSVRKKRGYWKLFYYTFGLLFIIVGSIAVLVFVAKNDPSMFGLTNEYTEQARTYVEAGDYDSAVDILEKCLSIDPSNADAIILLADIYHGQQRYSTELNILLEGVQSESNSENIIFYKRIVQAYVAQNMIKEACEFCDGLSSYMTRQMAEIRPENIQSTKDKGVYASAVTVCLTVPENCTVYYTTDGSYPDVKNSLVYDPDTEGIVIASGSVTVRAVAVNEANLVSNLFSSTYRIYGDNTPYTFTDEKVADIVRALLNRSVDDEIYYRDLQKIADFTTDVVGLDSSVLIQSLDDLTVMENLRTVYLQGETAVEDYSVLNGISSLQSLTVDSAALSEESMAQICRLTNVTELALTNDSLYDLSAVVSMTQLVSLDVSNNFITDIAPLAALEALSTLNVSSNRISDLSVLSGLKELSSLDISHNTKVTNLKGLSALSNLSSLNMSGMQVDSVNPLSSLKRLQILDISDSSVTSLAPLAECVRLMSLDVSGTTATDFGTISSLPLVSLTATGCHITDVTSLGDFAFLTSLDLYDNAVVSVAPLVSAGALTTLVISKNNVNDLETLLDNDSLIYLECSDCPVTGTVLSRFSEKGINVVY